MHAKRHKPGKGAPKSVDRCAAKLIALLDTGDYTRCLSPEQDRTVRKEIATFVDQLGADTFAAALHKLCAGAAYKVRHRADMLRGKR